MIGLSMCSCGVGKCNKLSHRVKSSPFMILDPVFHVIISASFGKMCQCFSLSSIQPTENSKKGSCRK